MIIDRGRIAAALPAYTLGAELGMGGFGLVLAGRHRRLQRDVAIKVIPAEAAVPGGEFGVEAQLLAGFDHPHIVRVHDYLEADGLGLIVMELCAGGALTRRRARLTSPRACAVGLALASGLAHAHARGVLHRDIKMSNVLFDQADTPKLSDFGIARVFTGSGVTGTGNRVGTPLYMAPEQIVGDRLTPATDLYALGILLYQLLTGAPPFSPSLTPPELWQRQLTATPPPMTGIPVPLTDVVMRALAKKPSDRQPDADSFAEQLAKAATEVHGSGWLADTGLPIHVSNRVRQAVPPSMPAAHSAPAGGYSDIIENDDRTAGRPRTGVRPPSSPANGRRPRQRRSRWFWLIAPATVLLAATVATLALVLPGGRTAVSAAQLQDWSRRLSVASAAAMAPDPALARRLAIAAYRTAPTPLARTQALSILAGGERPQAIIKGHSKPVYAVGFSPDGRLLATASGDGTARLWDAGQSGTSSQPLTIFTGHTHNVTVVTFSPDGRLLLTASDDHTARLWDTRRRGTVSRPLATLTGHSGPVYTAAFSPDGRLFATASWDGTARLWATNWRGAVSQPLATFTGGITGLAFSPNSRILATISDDRTARLWDTGRRGAVTQPLTTFAGHTDTVYAVGFSPNGQFLATASWDHTARLWDPGRRGEISQPLATLTGHTDRVTRLAFSRNARLVATASWDGTARLWDTTRRGVVQPLATFASHTGYVNRVTFSPDGQLLATTSSDQSTRLWDTTRHGTVTRPAVILTSPTGYANREDFSPDGGLLVTTNTDNTALLWNVDPGRLVATACAEPDGRLSRSEWDRVLPRTRYQPPCG
jgi:WD40 repeat protein/serine/threonine protein kinase